MRAAEWKRTVKPLLPPEVRWLWQKSLCYRAPVGLTVSGIDFESSRDANFAYVWRIGVPLYPVQEWLPGSFSTRSESHHVLSPGFVEGIRQGLTNLESEEEVIRKVASYHIEGELVLSERVIYSRALLGDLREALDAFREVKGHLEDSTLERHRKALQRLIEFETIAQTGDLDAVKEQLHSWAQASAAAIGLTRD